MKGISEIIATLLMLIIAIGLAGTAYMYISGFFTAKTAVVLSLDSALSYCNESHIVVGIRNDGTTKASGISVVVYKPDGTRDGTYTNVNVTAGGFVEVPISRNGGDPTGYYRVVISHPSSRAEGVIFCAVTGA